MTLNGINVLVGCADWAWAEAVRCIFAPRGINSMIASNAIEALDIIEQRKIHTAIVDMDAEQISGLGIIKVIRNYHPMLPCLLVSGSSEQKVLSKALRLNVFSVIAKPVDITILQEQLHRLFQRKYNSSVFDETHKS